MKSMLKFLVLGAGLLVAAPSFAYIPPSFFMVKKVAEKRAGFRVLKVATVVKEMKDKSPTGVQFKQVALFDERSGTLRSWALNEMDKPIFYQERKLAASSSGSVSPGPVMDYLLFQSQVVPLARALVGAGIPVKSDLELSEMNSEEERRASELTAMRRWNGLYAWSIGRDPDKAQLWIEKDGFLPVRLILPNSDSAKDLDFQLNLFRSSGALLYPHEVVLSMKGNLVLREEVVAVVPNATGTGGLPVLSATGLIDDNIDSRLKELLAVFYLHVR